MPLVKIKYVGSGETGLTVNNVYVVLGFFFSNPNVYALILNDAGVFYRTATDVLNTANWTKNSVSYVGCTSL